MYKYNVAGQHDLQKLLKFRISNNTRIATAAYELCPENRIGNNLSQVIYRDRRRHFFINYNY